MSNRKWITDRLPTAADADKDGRVTVQNRPKAETSTCPYFNWELVVPGMAWTHTEIWKAIPKPAIPKPVLAAGQRRRWRDGEEVTIAKHDTKNDTDYLFCAGGYRYRVDDRTICINDSDADLVELIEPVAEPAEIPEPLPPIKVGQTWRRADGVKVKVFIDDGTDTAPLLIGRTQENAFWYERNGEPGWVGDGLGPGSGLDLVELIEPVAEPAAEPEPVTTPRRFVSISRTVRQFVSISRTVWMDQGGSQCYTIDAVADDGTAWWMVPGETEWQQLPALPAREVPRF